MRKWTFEVTTRSKVAVLDVTAEVRRRLAEERGSGLVHVFVPHATCALVVNEAESGLLRDLERVASLVEPLAPFEHDRIDDNARSHLGAALLGCAVVLPVEGGQMRVGTWQSVLLVELDGPRRRTVEMRLIS